MRTVSARDLTGLCLAAAFAVAPARAADTEWKTIEINGEPGFGIDIPANVDEEKSMVDPAKGSWMAFFATGGGTDVACFLLSRQYAADFPRTAFVQRLAETKGEGFCSQSGDTISNAALVGSQSITSNGLPAARCASVYTKSDEQLPGMVASSLEVAASKVVYILSCDLNAEDQEAAAAAWAIDWKDVVTHIQDSLQLPASRR